MNKITTGNRKSSTTKPMKGVREQGMERGSQAAEITELQQKVFQLQEELMALRNARVLGKIIKIREFIGSKVSPNIRSLPKKSVRAFKSALLYYVPEEKKSDLVRLKAHMKLRLQLSNQKMRYGSSQLRTIIHENKILSTHRPLMSIIIPYFNRANTIDETLQSLTRQTYNKFEVYIIDDGSDQERSRQVYSELPERYPGLDIKLITQPNSGVAAARNKGIRHADGKYIICLDSDDMLEETYIEKCSLVLEANPDISIVTSLREDIGARTGIYDCPDYDAERLLRDNVVVTAAAFRKDAWERAGGYKSGIGYEDWDFWLTLAENGDWGVTLREPLFKYRVAIQSRYLDDKSRHFGTLRILKQLHPKYLSRVRKKKWEKQHVEHQVEPETALVNLANVGDYAVTSKLSVLITMPWMTFGGAETLTYNYCVGLKDKLDLSFVTGLPSKNEWDYKFREITHRIYHLPNIFKNGSLYLEFISLYIQTRNVKILHIVHNGYMFDMLPELKQRHPQLKIIVTMFNDRVPQYVKGLTEQSRNIDQIITDSGVVARSIAQKLTNPVPIRVIPNGIDSISTFRREIYDRDKIREELGIKDDNVKAVFFIGRLSEGKNPDVFVEVAGKILQNQALNEEYAFYIIGDGPEYPKVEKMVYKLKHKQIVVLGYKRDVARYLAAADIFILPSSIEGFPLSIIEAMAMGVAVVASRVGAIDDVVKNGVNGYTVTPGSAQEIEQALMKLRDSEHLKKIKQTNSKEAAEKYSLDRLVRDYAQLYRDIGK